MKTTILICVFLFLGLMVVGLVLYPMSVVFWDGSVERHVYIHVIDCNGFPAKNAQVTLIAHEPETKICDSNGNCEFKARFEAGGKKTFLKGRTGTFYLGQTNIIVENGPFKFDSLLSDLVGQTSYPLEVQLVNASVNLKKLTY